jgi:hypothetical protein
MEPYNNATTDFIETAGWRGYNGSDAGRRGFFTRDAAVNPKKKSARIFSPDAGRNRKKG